MVHGNIVDENDSPLAFATVVQKGTNHGTTTDSLGNFSINIKSEEDNVTLVASYVGYETTEKQISLSDSEIIIKIQSKPITLSDILVTGYGYTTGKITLGGAIAVCRKSTTFEKIDTSIRKVLKIQAVKIYPNPAIKGNTIHLEIKHAGDYQLQLLNNQSVLIMAEKINIISDKINYAIQIPSNITAGIYYLRLIDEQKKKSYTEKVIVQ